jgi:cytochrome c biogenesis protein CcmG/thiol:disulfide interchange protein DsbE
MMTDERLFALFEGYEEPAEPSPEFLDRLELELRRRVGHERRPLGWLLRTLVEAVSPRVAPPLRAAWAVALLALALALASAAALVGARLLGLLPTVEDVVLASQAVYADPPAFEMEVHLDDGSRVRYAFDGGARFRQDMVEGTDHGLFTPGGYLVRESGGQAWYGSQEAGANTWFVTDIVDGFLIDAYPLIGMEPGWIGRVPIESRGPLPWPSCSDGWQFGDGGTVAGRPADQVTCGTAAWWIDRESRLVLRLDEGGSVVAEALRLTLSPSFSAERFALDPPEGAEIAADEGPGDPAAWKGVLDVGQVPPTIEATYLDGTTFDSRTLRGQPTVLYFWGTWCPPCLDEMPGTIVREAADRGDRIRFITVGLDSDRLLAEAHDQVGGLPTVVDETAQSIESWRLFVIPALVLLDAQGRVAAVHVGVVDAATFDRMLDALAAGEPVPTPSPSQ